MYELAAILVLALIIDRAFGEHYFAVNPTVLMGRLIDFLSSRTKKTLLSGAVIFLTVTLIFSSAAYVALKFLSPLPKILLGAVILKAAFSWRALEEHALPVVKLIEEKRVEEARREVSKIVGRNTALLDEKHVLSAAVESIGENLTDGIVAPLFYFAVFGLFFGAEIGISAAIFYRAVNTLDSMVGYKKLGAFGAPSARFDDALNFLPSRISAGLIIASAFLLREDWRNAVKIFLRDRNNTPSPNSGQGMSALAGALCVRLEKPEYYYLGDGELREEHAYRAMRIVNLSVLIFSTVLLVIYLKNR